VTDSESESDGDRHHLQNPKSVRYLKSDRVHLKFLQHDVLALDEHSAHMFKHLKVLSQITVILIIHY